METRKIIIEDNGNVSVPDNVRMRPFEIAVLFGVYVQSVEAHIRAILPSGIAGADHSGPATVCGNRVVPDRYGLEMITAIAFRIRSPKAERFREWVIRRMTADYSPAVPAVPTFLIPLRGGTLPS
jgi:hypothetical protein